MNSLNFTIKNKTFEKERSLYNQKNSEIIGCLFSGKEDGESPLKESSDNSVVDCKFDLRYAFWHAKNSIVTNTTFSNLARAPFWYSKNILIDNLKSDAVKIFRECNLLSIYKSEIISEEPFWNCVDTELYDSKLAGFYAFFGSKRTFIKSLDFNGKYSFQYNNDLYIEDSNLNTKDAFWHCNHVVVINSVIKGEYIGWYSKNMTFINCTIESHQPFCYAKNLKLIDCKMPNCDLAFENSTVKGNIIGKIDSIKNPIKCIMKIDQVGELINENALHKTLFKNKKIENTSIEK